MKRILWCMIFLLVSAALGGAQTVKVPESWDKLAAKADEVVNVNLDRRMLQFALKFMGDDADEVEAKRLISKLNGIYVRSLEFKKPGFFTDADVEPVRAQMQGPEWSRIVEVDSKSDKERVEIYIKTAGGQIAGLVILAQEPSELTLVHLDGAITPEELGKLGGNFGIPKGIGGHHEKPEKPAKPEKPVKAVQK